MNRSIFYLTLFLIPSSLLAHPGNPRTHDHFNHDSNYPDDDHRLHDVGRSWSSPNNNNGNPVWDTASSSNSNGRTNVPEGWYDDSRRISGASAPAVSRFPGIFPHRNQMNPSSVDAMGFGNHLNTRSDNSNTKNHINDNTDNPLIHRISGGKSYDQDPFVGCERHEGDLVNSQLNDNNSYVITPQPMNDKSMIAVYPMIGLKHPMHLKIRMPRREYQAHIQGTFVELKRCIPYATSDMCEVVDEKSTKGTSLIDSQSWNYIYSQFTENGITIGINGQVNVMSMTAIPREELEEAEWLVTSGDDVTRNEIGDPFLVRYPCAEYVAEHLPPLPTPPPSFEPRTDSTDSTEYDYYLPTEDHLHGGMTTTEQTPIEPEESNNIVIIILVIVVAAVLVAAVIATGISMYKKRNGFEINDSTPLSAAQMKLEQKQDTTK